MLYFQLVLALIQCTAISPHFRTCTHTRLTGHSWITCSILVASSRQCTPLHYAAAMGHADTLQYLAEAGGDIHSKDDNGVSD